MYIMLRGGTTKRTRGRYKVFRVQKELRSPDDRYIIILYGKEKKNQTVIFYGYYIIYINIIVYSVYRVIGKYFIGSLCTQQNTVSIIERTSSFGSFSARVTSNREIARGTVSVAPYTRNY